MAFSLSTFQSALASGGARPSLFKMTISGQPTGMTTADVANIEYFCNISSLPPLTITPIERQYFGRTTKIPGDMTFGDLSTSIIQTEGGAERIAMEKWMDAINKTSTNAMDATNVSANGFTGTVNLQQYGKSGSLSPSLCTRQSRYSRTRRGGRGDNPGNAERGTLKGV